MRTRSQPLSPGGFISLERQQQPATRQTRSMRARSTSQTSAQSGSHSSQSHSSAQQQESQPSSEPVTRTRSRGASTKTTTTKKNTATKNTTTSTKKNTTKKSATTKRTATARKADATTASSSSKPAKAPPAKRAMQARAGRKSTRKTVTKSPEEDTQEATEASESPEADAQAAQAAQSPKIPNEDEGKDPKPTEATSPAAEGFLEPNNNKRESPLLTPSLPVRTQETHGPEGPEDGLDSLDVASLALEQFSDIGSLLSELSETPSIDLDEAFQIMSLELDAAIVAEAEANADAKEPSLLSPAAPARASPPGSLQTRGQSDSLEPVPAEGTLFQLNQSSEWSDAVDELTQLLGNLSLTDPIVMASIYADEPPVMPSLPVLDSVRHPVAESPGRYIPALGVSDLPPQGSMRGIGRAPPSMAPIVRASVEEPQFRPTTRTACFVVPTPLSPIPEESGRVDSDPPVQVRAASTRCLQAVEPVPVVPRSMDVPIGRRSEKQECPKRKKKQKELTPTPVNRKRPRVNSNEEADETPLPKRRTLRPPVSASLTRRLFPLSRRLSSTAVPYSERLKRRQAERQGRIHTTVFRLPELVAQTEADRRASEAEPSSPCPPVPQSSFDFPSENPGLSRTLEEPSRPQEPPRTPERSSGWNIRGLLSSVPRSFSRFIPRFGRSFEDIEESEQVDQSTTSQPSTPSGQRDSRAPHTSTPVTPPASAPLNQPSSEQARQSSLPLQVSGRRIRTPKTAPTKKSSPDLSYDLFPRPIDRSLYLPPKAPASKANELPEGHDESKEQGLQKEQQTRVQVPSKSAVLPSDDRTSRQISNTQTKKKRKRSPSPDVIPNPPGCSYGMDLNYFCYSSESEGEEEEGEEITSKPNPFLKSAVRNELRSEQHPSKKVRFDASPENTPSKQRGRATDPYHGYHFLGPGDSPTSEGPDSTATPAPATRTPSTTGDETPLHLRPGFIPNTQGTFGFDYDDFSFDESSSSGDSIPGSLTSPASNLPEQRTAHTQSQESMQLPRSGTRQAPPAPPSTPTAKVDNDALAKVRSQAEKYKPKTPSGLRTASRYSSSPMVSSPDIVPPTPIESEKPVTEKLRADKNYALEKSSASASQTAEKFGDDQFARDAEWLYENCPSGDLSKLSWPQKRSLVEGLGVDPAAEKILDEVWDESDLEIGYSSFRRGMEEFAATLV